MRSFEVDHTVRSSNLDLEYRPIRIRRRQKLACIDNVIRRNIHAIQRANEVDSRGRIRTSITRIYRRVAFNEDIEAFASRLLTAVRSAQRRIVSWQDIQALVARLDDRGVVVLEDLLVSIGGVGFVGEITVYGVVDKVLPGIDSGHGAGALREAIAVCSLFEPAFSSSRDSCGCHKGS